MNRTSRTPARSAVAIEIHHSTLSLVIIEPTELDDSRRVRTRSINWRNQAQSLHGDQGERELAKALKSVLAEERCSQARISLLLSGDFCVTRVITGDAEHVRRELAALEKRSARYLALGAGEKTRATRIYELDARNRQALLTVANHKTVDSLARVIAATGIDVDRIEPAQVSLCRILGTQGVDRMAPVLLVGLCEHGAELGISYRGRLMLDYRPGGNPTSEEVVDIVHRHLKRLQRYCDRHYRHSRGEIAKAFLYGDPEEVETALKLFANSSDLTAQPLDATAIDSTWSFDEPKAQLGLFNAAIGSCLVTAAPERWPVGPNFAEQIDIEQSAPLAAEIGRTFWPLAATLLIAVGLFVANWREQARCSHMASRMEEIEPVVAEVWTLQRETAEAGAKLVNLKALALQARIPDWGKYLSTLAQTMPNDLWLDKIAVDAAGIVTLSGSSHQEAKVYRFAEYLESAALCSHVVIEGTRPASDRNGTVTKFDIQCKFDDSADRDGE